MTHGFCDAPEVCLSVECRVQEREGKTNTGQDGRSVCFRKVNRIWLECDFILLRRAAAATSPTPQSRVQSIRCCAGGSKWAVSCQRATASTSILTTAVGASALATGLSSRRCGGPDRADEAGWLLESSGFDGGEDVGCESGYKRFGSSYRLHLQGLSAPHVYFSLCILHITEENILQPRRWRRYIPPKHW